jgi:hypothetical protein
MLWARMLAYITGTVDQELQLRNGYLAGENRILRAQIKGRLCYPMPKRLRWLRSPSGSDGKSWKNWRLSRSRIRCWPGTESASPTSSTGRDFANESVERELMRKVVIRPQSRIDPAESPVNTTQVFVTHPSTCWRLGEWNEQGVWLNI